MIQSGNRLGLPLEAFIELLGANLDRDDAVEPSVARFVDFTMPPAPMWAMIS
jgi:hypothetical protein